MSPVWNSHTAVLATAMAVSGTMIFLSLLRSSSISSAEDQDSSSLEAPRPPSPSPSPRPRSCLSSVKKDGRIKKKVRFADSVKDTNRKTWREVEYVSNCGINTKDFNGARNLLVEFSR
ncbi:hypothetical protein HanIR_Chr16g0789851 [Helianthus annuus]|nr:hypothetical protein HanIR_Chr16g0789851 [Helianthus annuus]